MLVVRLPKRSDITDLPEPKVFRCVRFGAFKGMLVGVISWPLVEYVKWGLFVNFVFDGVLAAILIALMNFLEKWPYVEYEFRHSFFDTISFASASTAVYFILNKVQIFLTLLLK